MRANLLLAFVSLLIFVGACEGIARLVELRPAGLGGDLPDWAERGPTEQGASIQPALIRSRELDHYFGLYRWDRFLFYRLRREVDLRAFDVMAPPEVRHRTGWIIRTNREGFREAPIERPKPPERFRLIALGDSSTFGWGVPAASSWPEVAEKELRRRHPGRFLEVLNLGSPGYTSFQGMELLSRVAGDLEPDAIFFSFGANDGTPAARSDREIHAARASAWGALLALLHRSRAYEALAAWVLRLRERPPGIEPPGSPRAANVSPDETAANLQRAVDWARERGIPLALVTSCLDGDKRSLAHEVAERTGTPIVDGFLILRGRVAELRAGTLFPEETAHLRELYGEEALAAPDSSYWTWLPDRCHPNVIGHHLLGEAVAGIATRWLSEAPRNR